MEVDQSLRSVPRAFVNLATSAREEVLFCDPKIFHAVAWRVVEQSCARPSRSVHIGHRTRPFVRHASVQKPMTRCSQKSRLGHQGLQTFRPGFPRRPRPLIFKQSPASSRVAAGLGNLITQILSIANFGPAAIDPLHPDMQQRHKRFPFLCAVPCWWGTTHVLPRLHWFCYQAKIAWHSPMGFPLSDVVRHRCQAVLSRLARCICHVAEHSPSGMPLSLGLVFLLDHDRPLGAHCSWHQKTKPKWI